MTPTPTITATPNPVQQGGVITVTYTNSQYSGDTVNITFTNGEGDPPIVEEVEFSDGKAVCQFTVPSGWARVQINAPGASQVTVTVQP